MTDVSIRAARPGDIAAITAIYADAVRYGTASFELEPPDEAEMARRQSALLAKGYPYLVAERSGLVAGYAYAGPYRDRKAYDWCVEDSIYIAPAFHRQGIGRLLLTRLIAESEARGFRQMLGVIGDSVNTASIAVHAACGFRLIGNFQSIGFKHGRWLDTVLMQRALGSGDASPPA
jgi:L-amino acid N-acyltransferase YncA